MKGKKHMFKLFFITNKLDIALAAEKAGVDRIWIDLEVLGKEERQKNLDSVKSRHSVEDIRIISSKLTKSEMMVRVNPWNPNSEDEIEKVIQAGTQVIMLPYWKTRTEVEKFIHCVNGRCKVNLLLETKEAVDCIDSIIELSGIDEIHIGLNDLQISYNAPYMFEPYANGLLDTLATKFNRANIPFGVGGIGKFGAGFIPSPEQLIIEQHRLGSTATILSRSFCNVDKVGLENVENILIENVGYFRKLEMEINEFSEEKIINNHLLVVKEINNIIDNIKE